MYIEQCLKRFEHAGEIGIDLGDIWGGEDRVIVDGGGGFGRERFKDIYELRVKYRICGDQGAP